MENYTNTGEFADMQELCNLLIDNGYRLVRVGAGAAPDQERNNMLRREQVRSRRREEQLRREAEVGRPELVAALKRWRREKADALNVPQYIVLGNMALFNIVEACPATMEDLSAVKGMGPSKIQEFGPEILEIVAEMLEVVPQ